jgi:hypothetical protein
MAADSADKFKRTGRECFPLPVRVDTPAKFRRPLFVCSVATQRIQAVFSLSHQIFGCMHGALNVGKKITNCTICL